jgi:GNAT superfamily N-acetyltransferase
LRRVAVLLRNRGVIGACRFLFSRLVYRRWETLVYYDDPGTMRSPSHWPAGYSFEVLGPGEIDDGVARSLQRAGAGDFLAGLDPIDRVYLVWKENAIVSYGGILPACAQRYVLGLPEDAVLIGGCFTSPEHRGRKLYPLALNETARQLRAEGCRQIYLEVHSTNTASIRGIEAARFTRVRLVSAAIWLGRMVRRDGQWHWIRKNR